MKQNYARIEIDAELLAGLMPFILVVDENLTAKWVSTAILKRIPNAVDMKVAELLKFEDCSVKISAETLNKNIGKPCKLILINKDYEIHLFGRWLRSGSGFVLLAAPELKNSEELSRFSMDDLFERDHLVDLLVAQEETRFSLKEAAFAANTLKNRNKELEAAKRQLESVNTVLESEIAERKKAEEELINSEEQLSRSNKELEQTVHTLEAVNTELKDFVYIASHDLREPLRKISSFGELLKESLAGKLEADDLENFGFMTDGADRMTKMIEGLLVYSRLNKDSESFTAVDLNELVEQLEQLELNILLEETSTIIEVSDNMPKVFGDEVQLKQLLQNFISNGIKYRAKDVQPRITITAEQIDKRKVKVKVRDNGIGIEEKYYNDVFKMFRRLHSRQEYEGTGIGLAVCKKIIDKHKGQIGVESEAGKGSTFWFILPMAAAERQESKNAVLNSVCI